MANPSDSRNQPLSEQDREDVKLVFNNMVAQVFDELSDADSPRQMYRPFEELIISLTTKHQKTYEDMGEPTEDDTAAYEAGLRVLERFRWR